MAHPRTPMAKAEATGTALRNPKRFSNRKEPKFRPLGKPPARLSETEREAWDELAGDMPWLARSDRSIVEVAAKLKARLMTDPEMGVNALAQLRMCLSSMGGTPADRSKVGAPSEEDDDPAAKFFQ